MTMIHLKTHFEDAAARDFIIIYFNCLLVDDRAAFQVVFFVFSIRLPSLAVKSLRS